MTITTTDGRAVEFTGRTYSKAGTSKEGTTCVT